MIVGTFLILTFIAAAVGLIDISLWWWLLVMPIWAILFTTTTVISSAWEGLCWLICLPFKSSKTEEDNRKVKED